MNKMIEMIKVIGVIKVGIVTVVIFSCSLLTQVSLADECKLKGNNCSTVFDLNKTFAHMRSKDLSLTALLLQGEMLTSRPDLLNDTTFLKQYLMRADYLQADWAILNIVPILSKRTIAVMRSPILNYYSGVLLFNQGSYKRANIFFLKIEPSSKYYRSAVFQRAYILYHQKKFQAAVKLLQKLMKMPIDANDPIEKKQQKYIIYQSALSLARIANDHKIYQAAKVYYAKLKKPHILWIDAMMEQSWAAVWMGDYNLALGNLKSINSIYFIDRYYPDSLLLEGSIYFMLCMYDDTRSALNRFLQTDFRVGNILSQIYQKVSSKDDTYFFSFVEQYYQDQISTYQGQISTYQEQTSADLAIPKKVLTSIVERKRVDKKYRQVLMLKREMAIIQQSTPALHKSASYNRSFINTKFFKKKLIRLLNKQIEVLAGQVGKAVRRDLSKIVETFKRTEEQVRLLYIELNMAEKDSMLGILGRNKGKIWQEAITMANFEQASTNKWKVDQKDEYWWDEIGNYLYNLESQCKEVGKKL